MKRYYHASLKIREGESANLIKCGGFYEKVNEDTGCPEGRYIGGLLTGFPSSKIPEISFSKSMEASIIAVVRGCEKDTIVFIYETEEEPDVDISHCAYDFTLLEEVRYRKDVKIRLAAYIKVPLKLIWEVENLLHHG